MNHRVSHQIITRDRDGRVISSPLQLATSFTTRLRGLMGRRGLDPEEGLLLSPCSDIHTFGMKFAIDVIFLDKQLNVVGLRPECRPRRFFRGGRNAAIALETAAGRIAATGLEIGDTLRLSRTDSHG
ncbi:DUF192 domain-containing protein [Marinobacter confluentis]|uniref:DUF192 domain-containing protein n=1 Tax=Marinobacter confluentis TaxID=1697557 RepID=A0A4Z1BPG2_9GAMM|nr:DUF192 domain-containing protein [Marinobacter confluentis]TGN41867.1 DUF192 domain-containing protein [Marinobacter confluentis]